MTPVLDQARFDAAAARFAAFFAELRTAFVERDDLLTQIALALLSREHVLMTGPPGTAKSQIASATLGRIVDEETGAPSLYARQFTESTVQTDLVGPIDFKTLMATGRTEHFTDEGMLGAVHAFLDEVLDGRDMLLRTTLNVLQERELKQGTRTTLGRIECALMTTNRYLAEVLETSRETLLAFIDRIAYVAFVPKGFAAADGLARVLRRQLGAEGAARPELRATLTIQDLDALQSAVDSVVVPPELCDALVRLVDLVDADLASAARSDPSFLATRYLSTRTAVRLGRALRAICVYDQVVRGADRALEAGAEDLGSLRLTLLLSGPPIEGVAQLMARETDARERRQLSILRTERDIFERCLARVPPIPKRPRPSPVDVQRLEELAGAPASAPPERLAEVTRELATAASTLRPGADAAARLLDRTVSAFVDRALRAGLTAGIVQDRMLDEAVGELSQVADALDQTTAPGARGVARWLRGRAVGVLDEAAVLAPTATGETLEAALRPVAEAATATAHAELVLVRIEQIAALRARLRAAGAAEPDRDASDAAWARALSRVEVELADVWDHGFRGAVGTALAKEGRGDLASVLAALRSTFDAISTYGARLAAVGGDVAALEQRVVGPRMAPLVSAAFERLDARDRLRTIDEVEKLVAELDVGGLGHVIAPTDLVRWSAEALVRAEAEPPAAAGAARVDHAAYRAARAREHRVPLAYTLVEIALRVRRRGPAGGSDASKPSEAGPALGPAPPSSDPQMEAVRSVRALLAGTPTALQARIVDLDLARVTRAVAMLEAWWSDLAARLGARDSAAPVDAALEQLAASRFFHVTRDEGALVRFALELRVVAEVFPEHAARAREMRERIDMIQAVSARELAGLLRDRADRSWKALLAPRTTA